MTNALLVDCVVELVRSITGRHVQVDAETVGCSRIRLEQRHGSDYAFHIYVYSTGSVEVCAVLPESSDRIAFWYRSFEPERSETGETLQRRVSVELHRLLTNDSRIEQHRGWLLCTFRCSVFVRGEWMAFGPATSFFRWSNFNIPPGRHRRYFATAIGREPALDRPGPAW